MNFTIDREILLENLNVISLSYSPIKGPEGNIEYLILLDLDKQHQSNIDDNLIKDIVQKAHAQLDK